MEIDGVNIEWIGHATFRITFRGITIYIDPYIMDEDPPRADMVLITHDHFDHCDENALRRIIKDDTYIVASESCREKLRNGIFVKPGVNIEWRGIGIDAVPAYNINKPFHPREKNYVGYVLRLGRVSIYHMGDTDFIPEMKELTGRITVALVPIGGTYTMDPLEASEAVNVVQPKIAVPMHYAYLPQLIKTPEDFVKNTPSAKVLEPRVPPPDHPQ